MYIGETSAGGDGTPCCWIMSYSYSSTPVIDSSLRLVIKNNKIFLRCYLTPDIIYFYAETNKPYFCTNVIHINKHALTAENDTSIISSAVITLEELDLAS